MNLKKKYLFKKVRFISGNFIGLTGLCKEVILNSTDEKAIFGIKMTFELSNSKIGYAYKSEHFELIN